MFAVDGGSMREKPTMLLLHGGPGFDHSNSKPDYAQLADAVQVPLLVLAGGDDPITPVGAAEEIVSSLPEADAALEGFENSSHFIQVHEPDRFLAVVRDFIAS
jgi:pimeloyl-ACP methyl ester carboxylesterase